MIGAIAGDVIGSVFEFNPVKSTDVRLFHPLSHFTDDTVMTLATAHAIVTGTPYVRAYRELGRRYPDAGYGLRFWGWLRGDDPSPYYSFGNGSAMRVSPVAWAFDDAEAVLREAERSAEVTHNHSEGIKGAQATALAIFRARSGASKQDIRDEIVRRFGYDLTRTVDEIRPTYSFDVTCQGSVPEALTCFLESTDFESAVRLSISLGGDADTLAAIAGSIAQAFYKEVPDMIRTQVRARLTPDLLEVLETFGRRFPGSV